MAKSNVTRRARRSASQNSRKPRKGRSLLHRSMENFAQIAFTDAWNAAWTAAKSKELCNVTLQNFLQAFIGAMRAEVDKKAAQLGVQS